VATVRRRRRIVMSVQSATQTTCSYCGETTEDYFSPGYCSEQCYFREKGEKALNTVRTDHTRCSSCGRIRATTSPPKPEEAFATVVDGAFNRVDGDVTYDAFGQDESQQAAIGFRHPTDAEEQGICECGTMGKQGEGHFDVLNGVATDAYLLRLRDQIKEACIEGQRETWPARGDLLRIYHDTQDLEYAVGRAL